MADIDSTLVLWSSTTASNKPAGATTIGTGLDDNLREIQGVVTRNLSHKGADIASAGTTDLGAIEGLMHDITGTTTITSFGSVRAGIWKIIKFEGALTLTHNATSLILPGAENITTADGDTALAISEGSGNWRVASYFAAAINPAKAVSTDETQTLTNKTIGAVTLSGTVSGGGNQLNNVIIGTVTPLEIFGTVGTFSANLVRTGAAGTDRVIEGQTAGVSRWQLRLGTSDAESGSNVGSDFKLVSYTDAGVGLATALVITRAGNSTFSGNGSFGGTLGISGGIYPGATQTAAALLSQASSGAGTTTTYIGNQTITTASDERIKANVRLWGGDASALLRSLPVKAWDKYLSDAPQTGYEGGYVGFTAQDLVKVAPWAVNTQGDTGLPWQARYEFLSGVMVKGWQDHESKLESLLAWKAEVLAANNITIQ